MPQWGQIVFELIFLFSLANMAAFGSQFTQTIDRVVNEQMDFRMQFFIKVRGTKSPTSVILTDRKRTAQILRAKTLRVLRQS